MLFCAVLSSPFQALSSITCIFTIFIFLLFFYTLMTLPSLPRLVKHLFTPHTHLYHGLSLSVSQAAVTVSKNIKFLTELAVPKLPSMAARTLARLLYPEDVELMVRASRCLPGEMAYLAKTADLQTVRQVASKVGEPKHLLAVINSIFKAIELLHFRRTPLSTPLPLTLHYPFIPLKYPHSSLRSGNLVYNFPSHQPLVVKPTPPIPLPPEVEVGVRSRYMGVDWTPLWLVTIR